MYVVGLLKTFENKSLLYKMLVIATPFEPVKKDT